MALNFSALLKRGPRIDDFYAGVPAARSGSTTPLLPQSRGGLNLSALTKKFFEPTPKVRVRDFVRELPGTLGDIGQSIARNIGSAGVTLSKLAGGSDVVDIPTSMKWLFKDEPVKSIELRVAEAEQKVKEWGDKNEKFTVLGSIAKNNPTSLAFAGVMGSVGLDLTPFGGTKKGVQIALKEANTLGDAISVLNKLGIEDDLAREFAEAVVKVKTDTSALKLIEHIADVQRTTKVSTKALKTTADISKAKASGQSFDEWVKGQDLYHGTSAEIQGGKLSFGAGEIRKGGQSGGLFLSDTPESAQVFGKTIYQA